MSSYDEQQSADQYQMQKYKATQIWNFKSIIQKKKRGFSELKSQFKEKILSI